MKEIENDRLLREFFAENKKEIEDKGFSNRVMHHLPNRINKFASIWSAAVMAVAAVLFVWMGGLESTWINLREICISMINHGESSMDPQSLIIAAIVLLFMGARKVMSLA